MIHGDEEFSSSDLIGGEYGYRVRKVVDNFIHSVLKTEEDMQRRWVDNRLTVACKYGFTLIYDEFTRSRPEANNTLLSVLQEKMLDLPAARQGDALALRLVDETAYYMGIGLANIIQALNPEVVVLGTIATEQGDFFLDRVRRVVCQETWPQISAVVEIRPSPLGSQVGDYGAISVILQHFV